LLVLTHDFQFLFEFVALRFVLGLLLTVAQNSDQCIQHDDTHQNKLGEDADVADGLVVGELEVVHVEVAYDAHAEH